VIATLHESTRAVGDQQLVMELGAGFRMIDQLTMAVEKGTSIVVHLFEIEDGHGSGDVDVSSYCEGLLDLVHACRRLRALTHDD
jgi:hypothetical protein